LTGTKTFADTIRQLYTDKTNPRVFLTVVVNTSGRVYDDFVRLLFLHAHREASALAGELQSERFRFPRAAFFANLKGSVVLI
jgi:hypothetical protein